MVRKKVYTKQHILVSARELLIKKGFSYITARNVAEHMGISTQPIYLEFKDMADLKVTLLKTTHEIIEKKFFYGQPTTDCVVNFGLNYIKFAKEANPLYLSLYLDHHSYGQELQELSFEMFEKHIEEDENFTSLTLEQRKKLHMNVWIVVTGLASLTVSGIMGLSEEATIAILKRVEKNNA